jgi:transcriptional regulator with XRE-family HTH domain
LKPRHDRRRWSSRWKPLGGQLRQRRAEIDPAFRNRAEWIRRGAPGISASVVRDIENGNRENYDDPTLAAIEIAYRLAPGSIPAFLDGDDDALVSAREPATAIGTVRDLQRLTSADPDVMDLDEIEEAIDRIEDLETRTEFRRTWRTLLRPALTQARREQSQRHGEPGAADGLGA